MGTATLSSNSSYYLDVDAAVQSQNQAGNYSIIYWRRFVRKTWGTGFWSGAGASGSVWSNVGQLWGPSSGHGYDFRGSTPKDQFFAEGTFRLNHDANGYANFEVVGNVTMSSLGSATAGSGVKSAPRIGRPITPPTTPEPIGLDQITPTSMRYRFSGANVNDGGSPILEWQIGYGTDINYPQFFLSSGGTSILPNLKPGTRYYVWARGRNAAGWGGFSARITAETLAGVRIKVDGVWRDAVPYVKVEGVWRLAIPYVKVNGVWKIPG